MNAVAHFTLRSLKANRVRSAVTIAGVALAAALLTAVLTSYFSLTDYLYRSEAAAAGTWMAYAEVDGTEETWEAGIARAKQDPSVTGMATLRDQGFAELSEEQQNVIGVYMPIVSVSGEVETIAGIRASEGRLPQSPDEIMLCSLWKDFDVNVGDEITLSVGDRQAEPAPGEEGSQSGGSMEAAYGTYFDVNPDPVEIVDGTPLNSSMGYLEAATDGGIFNERLVNLQDRSFRVVGFYDRFGYALSSAVGTCGVTVGESVSSNFGEVFLTMGGLGSSDEVRSCAEQIFPHDHIVLHEAMLRYLGLRSDLSLWDTFFSLVAILASVIALACVSLIFNAFNISVAQRMGQFGLLSSVGASRRQIRGAVFLEGFIVALIGIPLGIVVGLLGCAVTFAALGPTIADLAGNGMVDFRVAPHRNALIAAALLSLLTVLVSVWIPAKRASRVSIIDALRNSGSQRVSKRGKKSAAKTAKSSHLWRGRGVTDRLFGIGGMLARINRRRTTAKGRAASVSLALAIVLLMTAGSLTTFLGTLVGVVSGGNTDVGEVSVTAAFATEQEEALEASEGEGSAEQSDTSKENVSVAESLNATSVLARLNERFAQEAAEFARAYAYLEESPQAEGVGWYLWGSAAMVFPESMVGKAFRSEGSIDGGFLGDGSYGTIGSFMYLDDATFDKYAQSLGLNPEEFRATDSPRAIALASGYGNNGDVYQLLDIVREPGTVEVLAAAAWDGQSVGVGGSFKGCVDEGGATYGFQPYVFDSDGTVDEKDPLTLDDIEVATVSVEVAAVTDELPALLGSPGDGVVLIVPESLAERQGFGSGSPTFTGYFNSKDKDHASLATELSSRGGEFFHDGPFLPAFYSYNDIVEQVDSNQRLALVVNVFCMLFTVILALIALANVFNTITNSLILRRREFAVMKSVGLSQRQFRAMIMDECASFGIAGLLPGLVVSFGISWLMYSAIAQSLSGLTFGLPWTYVAIAVAMTVAAMGISVAYGMRCCKADSVVEALRSESV